MKKIVFCLVFCLTTSFMFSQTSDSKWLAGLGFHGVKFGSESGVGVPNFSFGKFSWTLPPSSFVLSRFLTKSFAADFKGSFGTVDFNNESSKLSGSNLAEKKLFGTFGLGARYKFANDIILKEDFFLDPYLRLGLNYLYYDYPDTTDFVMDGDDFLTASWGAGLNVWFNSNIGANATIDYNYLIMTDTRDADFTQISVGLVIRLGKGKDADGDGVSDNIDMCPEAFGLKELEGCPDTDGDGVKDSEDSCKMLAGSKEHNGCPDSDGDTVFDNEDNCPDEAGEADNNGCPWSDKDGDSVVDKDDKCPDEAGEADNNGCPWPDTDGDSVVDKDDKCPDEAGEADNNGCPWPDTDGNSVVDTDGDSVVDTDDKCPDEAGEVDNNGCPWPDTDGDSVVDKDDKCPDEAGEIDNNGCPYTQEGLKVQTKKGTAPKLENLMFKSNSDELTEESAQVLDNIKSIMNRGLVGQRFNIDGYTDSRGEVSYNKALSLKRAQKVVDLLVEKGVDINRLVARGFGEENPISSNNTAKGRSKNRRIEFSIIK